MWSTVKHSFYVFYFFPNQWSTQYTSGILMLLMISRHPIVKSSVMPDLKFVTQSYSPDANMYWSVGTNTEVVIYEWEQKQDKPKPGSWWITIIMTILLVYKEVFFSTDLMMLFLVWHYILKQICIECPKSKFHRILHYSCGYSA